MSVLVYGPRGVTRVNSGVRRGALSAIDLSQFHAQIRYWYGHGLSDLAVAMTVGCSDRTVQRYRYAHGLPAHQPHKSGASCVVLEQTKEQQK